MLVMGSVIIGRRDGGSGGPKSVDGLSELHGVEKENAARVSGRGDVDELRRRSKRT